MEKDVFSYITENEHNYRTARVPITNSKDWNMYEHIQRCKNVANAWYHQGKNDGLRPYNDIVTPIIDVAFRSEGFDVKDIVPFVNDSQNYYKSFLVEKYHPQWARKNELDTFIDEVVENSIIFDLALIKNVGGIRPEVVDLTTIAFCDQTDVMAGPICIKHPYTVSELIAMKGKWDSEKIDRAIYEASDNRKVSIANDQTVKQPSKNIDVYELRGELPEVWIDTKGDLYTYVPQMQIVCFYTDKNGDRNGITLYKGKDKPLKDNFKALKIDTVRSKGRACGRSVVERLFEPQVWNNYSGIKIKEMLDAAITVFLTDSDEIGNQKLSELKTNTVLKQEKGAQTSTISGSLVNLPGFTNYQLKQESSARELGSASEASLGQNPVSGTPFALQSLIVQEGQGIHDYRQGKIATFFADVLYRDWILGYLVKDMNNGKEFSTELSLDEMQELSDTIATSQANQDIKDAMIAGKQVGDASAVIALKKQMFMKGGTRKFLKVLKNELKDIPIDVFVNIKGKQRQMAQNADKITNIIREILANPQAIAQIPGVGKAFNELLQESGLSPIDFSQMTTPDPNAQPPQMPPQGQPQGQQQQVNQPTNQPVTA